MMRPSVVIVGAGLGGCMLARALLDTHDVTIIERGVDVEGEAFSVSDVGWPAVTTPHFGSGLGGSTQLWHNGLIEIEEEIFSSQWPIKKAELNEFYEKAFFLLSRVPIDTVRLAITDLRGRYKKLGLPDALLPGLYYPRWPMNVWEEFALAGRVTLVRGEVTGFGVKGNQEICSATVNCGGAVRQIAGDVFVLAAGGLGSPLLLQKLSRNLPLPALRHAGRHYEDHPMGFVGEVQVTVPLYKLWNFRAQGTDGNLRLPLVVTQGGVHVSFQLRPAATYYRNSRRERVSSVLNELRKSIWNPIGYFKLLGHWDDVLDILSFKFGIRLPTKHYTLLMTAQMPTSDEVSVWCEVDPVSGKEGRFRNWQLTESYQADLSAAIDDVLNRLRPVIGKSRVFPDWRKALCTGAHHSGTARMSSTADSGVCDTDCRVHGVSNLFVCDGSVIPSSGIANTGLTIAALALRLGVFLGSTKLRIHEKI
jgi:hypothetical protein